MGNLNTSIKKLSLDVANSIKVFVKPDKNREE